MMAGQSGWQPPVPSDGPVSPTTPVRAPERQEAPPPPDSRFGAVGMQSVLTRARDQSRFVAPPPERETVKKPFPLRSLISSLVLVLIIGVATGVVYVNQFRPVADDPDTIVRLPSATASTEELTAQTPQEIVSDYFAALAAGDLDRALAMGALGGNGSQALLEPSVFNRARELSPITAVEILSDAPTATEIPVRYLIGGEPFETTISLNLLDNGRYRLSRTTVTAEFSLVGGQNLPVLVNGQRIDPSLTFEVVPGMYEVTTGLPYLDYTSTSHLRVASPSRADIRKVNLTPELTEAGNAALLEAARKSLTQCLSRNSIAPDGCPNRATTAGNTQVSDASWRLTNNPWSAASPTLLADDQSVAVIRLRLETDLDIRYANGASSNPKPTIAADARASMTGTNPSTINVSWTTG